MIKGFPICSATEINMRTTMLLFACHEWYRIVFFVLLGGKGSKFFLGVVFLGYIYFLIEVDWFYIG